MLDEMLLFLIRHAVTAHTGRRLTGWLPGVQLSDEGRLQAEAMVRRMEPVGLDAVYSSPVERALETAKPLASSKGLRVRVRDGLGEVRYGEWEGRTLASIARTSQWRRVLAHPSEARFPGGETIRETQARVLAAVREIAEAHPKGSAAVVSHADVIKLAIAHYAGIHLDLYSRLGIAPASVSGLWIGDGAPRIIKVNDTGSLDRLQRSRSIRRRR
jgi:probable phosphoglycerate mutase